MVATQENRKELNAAKTTGKMAARPTKATEKIITIISQKQQKPTTKITGTNYNTKKIH